MNARAFIRTYQMRENVREANNQTPSQLSSNRYLSWNGQATYVYDNRYIVSGNISRMGSDNYAPENRWGTFWGASAGWVASEEPWLKNANINLLKLRASFGHTGQANTYAVGQGRYPFQSTWGSGTGYSFGTSSTFINGMNETMIGNYNNRWEVSDMFNFGLDFDFWNKKLYGSFDVFKEWRSNILVTRSNTPTLLGVAVSQDSYGKVETKGVELTIGHRNKVGDFNYYIEGLFLSSGIIRDPDYTMEKMIEAISFLRYKYHFHGYIHAKVIPGASPILVQNLGSLVDRLSANIELPTENGLKLLAPDKNSDKVTSIMKFVRKKQSKQFTPAGQSTQMIVGATPDSDRDILRLSSALYQRPTMKRVYYSGYIHVNTYDTRLPALPQAPLVRENRLYQADWLLRFYQFKVDEIVDDTYPNLDLEIDPKLSWALRHPELFPVDVNKADYELLLRVPGIGVKSAKLILLSRRYGLLTSEQLKKMGVVWKKAQYFVVCRELPLSTVQELTPEVVRRLLVKKPSGDSRQLILPFDD